MTPLNSESLNLLDAMDLMDSNQMDDLMNQLEDAVSQKPNDVRTLLTLANGYYIRGKIKEALKVLDKAIQVNPKIPYAYYYRGVALYRMVRLEEAIESFKKVITLAPNILMAYYWLGIALWHTGDFREARRAFLTLLDKNNDSPIAHYHTALCCLEEQCYESALKHLEALAKITKHDSRVYKYLGEVYYRLDRTHEAIEAYRKGLELSPDNPEMREALNHLTQVPDI